MNIIDDPMLILIARFVGADRDPGVSEQAFLQTQVEAIESYVADFPGEERNRRALEWVEKFAEKYRQNWQRSHLPDWLRSLRCPDCPLAGEHGIRHCEIHEQWSELLSRYIAEEISSGEYVQSSLRLLCENKQKLKKPNTTPKDCG